MARPQELIPGNCYFLVNYYDSDLLFPSVQTLVYAHREEFGADESRWIFRQPQAVAQPSGDGGVQGDSRLVGFSAEQLYQVLDFPGLLRALGEVAVDHPLHPLADLSSVRPPDADLGDLREQVHKFLGDAESAALAVQIRFTDDGFSIARREEGGFEMIFFPRVRFAPPREASIRSLFAGVGVKPHRDYLADRGRTRILHFGVPDDEGIIVQLATRVLLEVYTMRTDDSLIYKDFPRPAARGAG